MELKYALFLALAAAVLGTRCVLYWLGRLKSLPSLLGAFLIGIGLFGSALLLLLFAPDSILVPVTIIFLAFVMISCIGIWITGG